MNRFRQLGLSSKILLTLLVARVLSIALTAYIGYSVGRNGLQNAVVNQLTGSRDTGGRAIAEDFQLSENFPLTLSEGSIVIDATKAFKRSRQALKDRPPFRTAKN